jgi:hypothetical protein
MSLVIGSRRSEGTLQRSRGQRRSKFSTKLPWKPQGCCDQCCDLWRKGKNVHECTGNRFSQGQTELAIEPSALSRTSEECSLVFSGPACSLCRMRHVAGKVVWSGPSVTFIAQCQMRVTYIWPWSSCRHLHLHHRQPVKHSEGPSFAVWFF